MKGTSETHKLVRSLLVALVALALFVPAVSAAGSPSTLATGPGTDQPLPPLPDWPIVGPILRMLGVVQAQPQPEALPTPDPAIPEYRITSIADAEALPDFAPNERVRLIASESDLNTIIADAIAEDGTDGVTATLDVTPGLLGVTATVNQSLLEQANVNIPRLGSGDVRGAATMTLGAANCQLTVGLTKVSINGWSLGLRGVAQRTINARLPEAWPQEVCLEHVYLMNGDIAVEGYRR